MKKDAQKSKEELLRNVRNKNEIARKRKIIIDNFYPALIGATISVDEAKRLVSAMSSLLMEEVLKTMKERKFNDIKESIQKVLCSDGERLEEIKSLLETLKEENLFVAREIIEGMSRAIETMIMEDMADRKLDTLKPDWDKYLNG